MDESSCTQEFIDSSPLVNPQILQLTVNNIDTFSTYPNACIKLLNLINKNDHVGIRSIRRDGNCFFRAFLFGLAELLVVNVEICGCLLESICQKLPSLFDAAGYERIVWEDLLESAVDFFEGIRSRKMGHAALVAFFNNCEQANSLVMLFRFAVGAVFRTAPQDRYMPFVNWDEFRSWDAFVAAAESFGKESDQLSIGALCEVLNVSCRIFVVDNSEERNASQTDAGALLMPFEMQISPMFNESDPFPLCIRLIYRPGHYDLLYVGCDQAAQ